MDKDKRPAPAPQSHRPAGVQADVLSQTRQRLAHPSLYKVLLLNDDYTPMDFVVHVLERHFHKSPEQAMAVMLQVHHEGSAVCGLYTREVAETKVAQVTGLARQKNHPLQCTFEKA
ncbi:ATP-dependent Clp protease adapter ClpS [Formicincola oecophyllae]|uniref:ATP-dependent Clp protease adapter protein ClpS n=1 Tax=Formicincola oecophyllae TaxID=2558361 RepID=A0A4Y6U8E0_9PROT|nr:ATP-dependent Clp protease adapter ClpS [Formicincola oecophyllae]QDH13632.1 ATP-dependent Clp protease adapter ClpS [Formicincola oecophyllae]